MPPGRPPLRIGAHGKIIRKYLGGGVWSARCRYRDSDGVTRIVERRGPADENDRRGKLAAAALIEELKSRRDPGVERDLVTPCRAPALQCVNQCILGKLATPARI